MFRLIIIFKKIKFPFVIFLHGTSFKSQSQRDIPYMLLKKLSEITLPHWTILETRHCIYTRQHHRKTSGYYNRTSTEKWHRFLVMEGAYNFSVNIQNKLHICPHKCFQKLIPTLSSLVKKTNNSKGHKTPRSRQHMSSEQKDHKV